MAESAYSVSPLRRDRTTGPKPMENRCTRIPRRLATTKWPSSWTNTRTPSATAKARNETNGPVMSIGPFSTLTARKRGVVVDEHHREQETVQPVQDATVARYNPAGILGAESALERRLAQVAQLGEQADRATEPERLLDSEPREEDHAAEHGDEHGAGDGAGRPLDGLARADRGQQLPPPVGPPGEVAARVGAHGDEHGEQHPAPAVGSAVAEQHNVRRDEADIEDAEDREPEPVDRAREVPVPHQREHQPADDGEPEPRPPELRPARYDPRPHHQPPHDTHGLLQRMLRQRHREVLEEPDRRDRQYEPRKQSRRQLPHHDPQPRNGNRRGQ